MSEHRPLVVISDEALLDEVLRIAAATACAVERAPDVDAARLRWPEAPLVVVDETVLGSGDLAGLSRRSTLVLVAKGRPAPESWQRAYHAGAGHVIALPDEEDALVALLADLVEGPSEGAGKVLATIGGRGGGGATVLAAAAAIEVSRAGGGALLVDCDRLGGGLDLVLGAEHDAGLRWPDLSLNAGRVSMSALREALPDIRCGSGRLVLLSCGRDGGGPTPEAVAAVIAAGSRAGYTVICDLPRDLDTAGWEAVDRADLVAVVVPAEVRASAAARRIVEDLAGRARRTGIVVRGPAPDALAPDAIEDAVGAEVLAVMRAEPKLARNLERAEFAPKPAGPLARGARAVLESAWWEQAHQVAA